MTPGGAGVIVKEIKCTKDVGFTGGSVVMNLLMQGDMDWNPGSGRCPGEGNGNSLQYSGLKNPMDRGAWWATVHGVTNSWTRLSMHTQEQEM